MSGKEPVFSKDDLTNMKNAFDAYDEERKDKIKPEVLGKLLRALGFNPLPEEVEDMLEDVGGQDIDFKTFAYLVYRHAREADPAGELIASFRVFDKDGTGKLPVATIRQILSHLKQPFEEEQIDELISKANPVDDQIDYTEFADLMLNY